MAMNPSWMAGFGRGLNDGHQRRMADAENERAQGRFQMEIFDEATKHVDRLSAVARSLIEASPDATKVPQKTLAELDASVNDIATGLADIPGGRNIAPALIQTFRTSVQTARPGRGGTGDKARAGVDSARSEAAALGLKGDEAEQYVRSKFGIGRREKRSALDIEGTILEKVASGEALTAGEQKAWDMIQERRKKDDPLAALLGTGTETAASGPSVPTVPSKAEQPPVKGARKAPDGNWYIEQNGVYYRVD